MLSYNKASKNKKVKMENKKSLIALIGIVALLAIGGAVAYYTSFVTLDN